MDVKIGNRQHRDNETEDKKIRKVERCKASTSAELGLRIHGISMYSKRERKMVLRDKYWGRELSSEGVNEIFREFVDCAVADAHYIVDCIVKRLELIVQCVQDVTWRFYGSSILIVFDSNVEHPLVQVKLIDFGSCDMNTEKKYAGYDEGFAFGLMNLIVQFKKSVGLDVAAEEKNVASRRASIVPGAAVTSGDAAAGGSSDPPPQ
jgi:hypothetical protein